MRRIRHVEDRMTPEGVWLAGLLIGVSLGIPLGLLLDRLLDWADDRRP
jgi:ABC-type nitrate/sulfonate/bicarbonate transport system permease component